MSGGKQDPTQQTSPSALTEREILNQQRDDLRVEFDNTGLPITRIMKQFDDIKGIWRERTFT